MRDLVAAVLTGLTVASISLLLLRPTRPLASRVEPYSQRARLLLGQPVDPSVSFRAASGSPSPTRGDRNAVLAPLVSAAAARLSALVDAGGDAAVQLRLRHAGRRDLTPDRYRAQQLTATVQGVGIFVVAALAVAPSGATVLLAGLFGGAWGAARWRSKFDRAITRRREQMRAELYTVAQMLAIHLQAGSSPLVAVEGLTRRGSGEVATELALALDWIADKVPARQAFERLAAETVEPAAARLYRLLATSDTGAGESLALALLHTANDLRTQRREDVERLAAKRRFQMLMPMILIMGPVLLLFLVAPLPTLILGD
jgi:Flp pilus assembly protein TadB